MSQQMLFTEIYYEKIVNTTLLIYSALIYHYN